MMNSYNDKDMYCRKKKSIFQNIDKKAAYQKLKIIYIKKYVYKFRKITIVFLLNELCNTNCNNSELYVIYLKIIFVCNTYNAV